MQSIYTHTQGVSQSLTWPLSVDNTRTFVISPWTTPYIRDDSARRVYFALSDRQTDSEERRTRGSPTVEVLFERKRKQSI